LLLPREIVQIWLADLNVEAGQLHILSRLLNEQELRRAERLHFAEDRRRFVVARAFLRQLLGLHLGIDPKGVRFRYEPRGKPALAHRTTLQFNLSHSSDVAVAAVTRERRVGIDVEVISDTLDFEDVGRRYFCASEAQRVVGSQGAERRRSFYFHWTGKEAYLKAQGDGLFAPLDSFEVIPGGPGADPCLRIDDVHEHGRWSLRVIQPRNDIVCAVVAEGSEWHLRTAEWLAVEGRPFAADLASAFQAYPHPKWFRGS
jgi:4'-phosphopantetheinyl transferase